VLDLAVPFCLAGRGLLARLAAVVLLPPLALCLGLQAVRGWSWTAVWLLAVLLGDFTGGVFAQASGELMFEEPGRLNARSVLARFGRRLPAYLLAYLASRLAVLAGALTVLLLPSVALRLPFVREVVLLEGAGGLAALARSARIVHRHGATSLGLGLALVAAPLLFVVGAEILGDAVVRRLLQLGRPVGNLAHGGSAYALIGFFLSVPVTAAARFLAYIDLRTRKEGWDIQLRFTAVLEKLRSREAA
jgi:hypothetical protein